MREYSWGKWYCVRVLQVLTRLLVIWPLILLTALPAKIFDGARALSYAVDDWWWE